jgi:hypothetical protein
VDSGAAAAEFPEKLGPAKDSPLTFCMETTMSDTQTHALASSLLCGRYVYMLRPVASIDTMEMVYLDPRWPPLSSAHFSVEASGHCMQEAMATAMLVVHSIELLYLSHEEPLPITKLLLPRKPGCRACETSLVTGHESKNLAMTMAVLDVQLSCCTSLMGCFSLTPSSCCLRIQAAEHARRGLSRHMARVQLCRA